MSAKPKNEKVLHTRIPAQLEDEIKKRADALRIPVSNLVRNVLEDTFSLVNHVTENVDEIVTQVTRDATRVAETARSSAAQVRDGFQAAVKPPVSEEAPMVPPAWTLPVELPGAPVAPAAPAPGFGSARGRVFAWQPVTANTAAVCADCAAPIQPGEACQFGLTGVVSDRVFLCGACLKQLQAQQTTAAEAATTPKGE